MRLEPHRVALRYRFRLFVVAVAMVLLPLAYFVLVALFGLWVGARLLDPPAASNVWALVGYLLLCVAGPVTVVFMIKPWFSRRPEQSGAIPLGSGEAPDLECFVGLLARSVGAPGPKAIELDCTVNASAGFRGGLRGMLRQELKLTLGLPLVGGLDMRSFAGVLAHELGHFSQRGGMRLAWCIMHVNQLFARLVHERDRWDERVQEAAHSEHAHVQLFGLATWSLIWLARQPLRVLMIAGQAISGFALREMEFDADGYEIVFAGSDAFRRTSREINLLNVGASKALRLIGETLPDGRLPQNLPLLARVQAEGLPDRVRRAVEEEMMAESPRRRLFGVRRVGETLGAFFSTHPSDRERIEVAESFDTPGLVHCGVPARALFKDFDGIAEKLTEDFYCEEFGPEISGCELVDNGRFKRVVERREHGFSACEAFFDGRFTIARPLLFSPEEVRAIRRGGEVPDAGELRANAAAMGAWVHDGRELFEQFEEAEEAMIKIERASELFQAGFRIRPKAFGLPRSLSALSDRQKAVATRRDRARVKLAEFDRIARKRIGEALSVHLAAGALVRKAQRLQTRRVLRVMEGMGGVFPTLLKLRRRVLAQRALLQNLRPATLSRSVIERLQRNAVELLELSAELRSGLARIPYPFDHATGKISVADYAKADFNDRQLVARSYKMAEAQLERLFDLHFRVMGYLCSTVEAVESGSR